MVQVRITLSIPKYWNVSICRREIQKNPLEDPPASAPPLLRFSHPVQPESSFKVGNSADEVVKKSLLKNEVVQHLLTIGLSLHRAARCDVELEQGGCTDPVTLLGCFVGAFGGRQGAGRHPGPPHRRAAGA